MATARYCVLACLALGLLLPERASGAPAVAAAAVVGNVTGTGLINPGQRRLANGARLQENDQILLRTGKLSLKMADGTVVKLAAPAQFQIETVRDPAGRARLRVDSGRAHVSTRQRKGSEVQVITPSATLAVRGSSGGVDVTPQGTLCWCDEGLVYVDAAGERVVLRPGYQSWVAPGGAPGEPEPMSDDTHALSEGLSLGASLRATPDGLPEGGEDDSDDVAAAHIAAAEALLRQAYDAYEREDLPGLSDCLSSDFSAQDRAGVGRDLTLLQESLRQDFLNLDNARFFRQPGSSSRFYPEGDLVSLHERWVLNALFPSGIRLQQGGETLFTIGADPAGAGLRLRRWEGDTPFGRYHPVDDVLEITSPTVLTPALPGAPDVLLTRGSLSQGGYLITGADAQVRVGGVLLQAERVSIRPDGSLELGEVTFTLNGAQVRADRVIIDSSDGFRAEGVVLLADGTQVEAESLEVANGTVSFGQAILTDPFGNRVTLTQGTVNVVDGKTVFTGVSDAGQTISTEGGQILYEPAPGVPLPTGRGERLGDGQGIRFATGAVSSSPGDLFVSGGRLEVDGGAVRLGVVPFAEVRVAPAEGYRQDVLSLDALVPNEVLVLRLAAGGYAKILVRLGTSAEELLFDWVYNPEGAALTRARRWPSRAQVAYEAKLYSREATGHQAFLQGGTQTLAEVRVESARNLGNGAALEAYLAPRLSTDRQVNRKNATMDRFGVRYFQPGQYEVSLGDLSGEFTPYTLNQTLLGLVGWRSFPIGPVGTARLSTAIGPRWRPGAGLRVDGWVTGLRLATDEIRDLGPLLEDMTFGLNVVKAYRGKQERGDYLASTIFSVDAALRTRGGLGLQAEYAFSRSDDTVRIRKGEAFLLRGAYRLGPVRLIMDRERVGSHFVTVSGTAINDQERTNVWLRFRPNQWFSANFNLLHTRDNLDDAKPYTTEMTTPRYGFSITPFYPLLRGGFLRNLTFDLLLRTTLRASDDAARSVDRKYRTLSLSLIQRMGDFTLIAGRDETRDLDATPTGISRRGWANDLSLRWRPQHRFLPFPISPVVGFRSGRDTYLGGPSGVVSSRLNSRRIGLAIGDYDSLAVELGYELLDNHRTDLGGYDRRVLNIDLTRALDAEGTRTAGLSYRLLSNEQENGARQYTEGQLTGSIRQQF